MKKRSSSKKLLKRQGEKTLRRGGKNFPRFLSLLLFLLLLCPAPLSLNAASGKGKETTAQTESEKEETAPATESGEESGDESGNAPAGEPGKEGFVYCTTGHGETALNKEITDWLAKRGNGVKTLDFSENPAVPADAAAVVVHMADRDFEKEETEALKNYFESGGNVLLFTYFNTVLENRVLENLYGFAEELGLSYSDRLVFEGDEERTGEDYGTFFFFPRYNDLFLSEPLPEDKPLLLYYCHAIRLAENPPENLALTELFSTSIKGYTRPEIGNGTEKEEGDPEGAFCVGAMAERIGGEARGRLIWLATPALTDEATYEVFSDFTYLTSVFSFLCKEEESGEETTATETLSPEETEVPVTLPPATHTAGGKSTVGRWVGLILIPVAGLGVMAAVIGLALKNR